MMASDDRGGWAEWPTFRLVTPDMPPDVPVAARELLSAGVPKSLVGSYDAAERATLLAKDLVCFGDGLPGERICLEVPSGAVVHVLDLNPSVRRLVNSNLDLFRACAKAVIERFPFYDLESEEDAQKVAADDVRAIVRRLDPPAIADTGFWETFTEDIEMGNHFTEDILGLIEDDEDEDE
jgi:SUKH-4 immunity protein